MRVVIIADRLFASRERSMLARLQVGLADEGLRVVQALPIGVEPASGGMLTETVSFEETGPPFSLHRRAAVTAQALLDSAKASDGDPPAVVHAFGSPVWDFGLALAEKLDAAFILEAWRAGLARAVQRSFTKAHGRAGQLVLCPDAKLAQQLRTEIPEAVVRHSPWGVYTDEPTRPVLQPGKAWSIMIAGAGYDRLAFATAFEAIADIVRTRPDMLVFADALAARRTDLWKLAARLGIRERLSLVDEMDTNRDLVLRGDMLILPEARGEQRTLVLEAMGRGMPVVAAADPLNGSLIDGRSALLVPANERTRWVQQLEALLSTPELVTELTTSARAYIAEEHRPSRQVNCVIDAYEAAVGKKSIPFPG